MTSDIPAERILSVKLGAWSNSFRDWLVAKWILLVIALLAGFVGKFAYDHRLMSIPAPVSTPTTIVQNHEGPTTIVTQVVSPPAQPVAPLPVEKEEKVVATTTTQASSSSAQPTSSAVPTTGTTATTLPSTTTEEPVPVTTTTQTSEPTTSEISPSASEAP